MFYQLMGNGLQLGLKKYVFNDILKCYLEAIIINFPMNKFMSPAYECICSLKQFTLYPGIYESMLA